MGDDVPCVGGIEERGNTEDASEVEEVEEMLAGGKREAFIEDLVVVELREALREGSTLERVRNLAFVFAFAFVTPAAATSFDSYTPIVVVEEEGNPAFLLTGERGLFKYWEGDSTPPAIPIPIPPPTGSVEAALTLLSKERVDTVFGGGLTRGEATPPLI